MPVARAAKRCRADPIGPAGLAARGHLPSENDLARTLLKLPSMLRLALASVMVVSLNGFAYDLRTDSEGDVVKWTRPLELTIDSRLAEMLHADGAIAAVERAIKHCDDATPGLQVSARIGDAKPIGYVQTATDNTNSVLVLDDWPYSSRALAVTLVTLNARTNELLDADVAFNAEEHRFKVLSDDPAQGYAFDDVQNTITHELGHVLGLMHNANVEDLVMYPSAPPGEILKRQLKQDDRDGLLSLYTDPVAPVLESPLPVQGCSSSGGAPLFAAFGALMLLVLRRRPRAARSVALIAVTVASGSALAGEPDGRLDLGRAAEQVAVADDVVIATVGARASFVHPQRPGMILTRITFAATECVKGSCAQLPGLVVPGGRIGELEQVVIHEPVPAPGERIVVTRAAGKVRLIHVEPSRQLMLIQRLRESAATLPASNSPSPTPSQVPATTR